MEDPKHWKNARMVIRKDVFSSERIHSVRSFKLEWRTHTDLVELFFSFLIQNTGHMFDKLLICTDVSSVSPEVLASAVCNAQEVILRPDTITASQLEAMCRAIQDLPERKLKRLHLDGRYLTDINGATLSDAVCVLDEVNLRFANVPLTSEERERIKSAVRQCLSTLCSTITNSSQLRLRALNLNYHDHLESVEPKTLASMVCRVETMGLVATRLTTSQVQAVFRAIRDSQHVTLRELDMGKNKLSTISPQTLAAVMCMLEDINIGGCEMTEEQLEHVFTTIKNCSDLKLRKLNMNHLFYLSTVSPSSLAPALCKVVTVNLECANITTTQIEAVFSAISECSSLVLEKLDVRGLPVKTVPPKTLAGAVNRLDSLNIYRCDLTTEQLDQLEHLSCRIFLAQILSNKKKLI